MGIRQQWKLNNNNKRTHDVFIRESNNNENYIIITKEHTYVFIRESNSSEN